MAEQRMIAAAAEVIDHEKAVVEHIEDRELSSRGSSSSPKPSIDSVDDASLLQDFPTEEEQQILRRVPDKIPLKVFTIAFVELCERFSYYGTTVVVSC